ncbi:13358_t:CDS:2 [Rhizophagus irregularis]|nr:13358_t:CDS:2 [Rhizophagus irregularis]
MPRLTKHQKRSRKAYEAKSTRKNNSDNDSDNMSINDDSDNVDDTDNFSVNDEPVENDNAVSIVRKLKEAAKKYHQERASHEIRRLRYIGNSVRTRRRKNQQLLEAAKGTLALCTFWDTKKSTDESDNEIEDCNWNNKIQAALENLEIDIKKENKKNEVWVRLNGIRLYLQLVKCNYSKMNASEIVSNTAGKGVYHARCIRSWAHEYVMSRQIPYSRREHHAKIWSFLWDEDILLQVKSYIREHKWDISPQMLMIQMNEIILPGLGFAPSPTIHINTARNYLKELGYTYAKVKKGIYIDGHEREGVVVYRKIFLEQMSKFEHRMPIFSGDNLDEITWPDSNIQPLILVTHDECIFSAYDGSRSLWIPDGEQPLRKKGNGRSIHVSEFLTDVCGRLALPDEMQVSDDFPREACVIMHPGKNNDGWWKADDLISQVIERAIPIFEARFPGCQALFAFDNASSHATFSPDALIAKNMNLNPGGKQPKMRRTYFGDENIQQDMIFPSDYCISNLRGQPKGLKQVLMERGLWPNEGLKLEEARKIMSQQPDFFSAKGTGRRAKKFSRSNCDYLWTGLQRTVSLALASVPLTTIRRYARKAFRYMDVYRKGLTGKAAEFAVKKYRSHRRVPDSVLQSVGI